MSRIEIVSGFNELVNHTSLGASSFIVTATTKDCATGGNDCHSGGIE